jgi:dTDP-4-amino-4,6-dideoxygalactose transaminase
MLSWTGSSMRSDAADIGTNVHYSPVCLHSFYQRMGYQRGIAPVTEAVNRQVLTLPLLPAMTGAHVTRVVAALVRAV